MFGYSPRSAAMGFCAVNLVDGRSSFHNPAAMGLYHLERDISATWTEYPRFGHYGILHNFGVSVKLPYISNRLHSGERFQNSVGLGYCASRLKWRSFWGSTDTWFDKSNYYSVGVGLEYIARLGFGFMYSDIETTLEFDYPEWDGIRKEDNARDYGIILQLPVFKAITSLTGRDVSYDKLDFELVPSFAYIWSNIGGKPYIAERFDNAGLALLGNVNYNQAPISSLIFVMEKENYMSDNKRGYEFSFGGFYFLRWGEFKNELYDDDYKGYTKGYGFSLRGVSNWLYSLELIRDRERPWDWFLKHMDITYDVSNFDWGVGDRIEDNILNVSVSF
jgi:hypothetical protein